METPCTACGFPSEDDRWCEACEEVYHAKDPNYYDLGGSNESNNSPGKEN